MDAYTFNFIIPPKSTFSLSEVEQMKSDFSSIIYFKGEFIWSVLTYCRLKDLGMKVTLSQELNHKAINLAHGNVLRSLEKKSNCFCVSLQADFPQYPLAHYHIVQNELQISTNAAFIPHWPLAGQEKRHEGRDSVRRIAYQGVGHFTELDEYQLNQDLKPHGLTFEMLNDTDWRNLGDVDILIGIRSFSKKLYKRKPPTKLIGAWLADIPFVGGWDSAYSHIGTPGKDYLRVCTYEETLQALIELKNNRELYHKLVLNGKNQATRYSFESTSEKWKELLTGEICRAYDEWLSISPSRKKLMFTVSRLHYDSINTLKKGLRLGYSIPILKMIRDRFYDPVK